MKRLEYTKYTDYAAPVPDACVSRALLFPGRERKAVGYGRFGLSFLTDVLDGFIARHFNQVSDLGKILQTLWPIKVMQITSVAFASHFTTMR